MNDIEDSYESGDSNLLLARSPVQFIHNLNIPTDITSQPSFEFSLQNFHLVLENPYFDIKDAGC